MFHLVKCSHSHCFFCFFLPGVPKPVDVTVILTQIMFLNTYVCMIDVRLIKNKGSIRHRCNELHSCSMNSQRERERRIV